ncbi:hypothetical protein PRIPAC_79121 [Pristionchus pacificus]|uniref:Uncharacterized protein n=1 Tax=Pristionchus pacificus TaxID=54126 RepID=A0A2A6CKB9_PRIPA|nr:hypothetical protein PRIPAC_79121 [Pristionchus pacificus]|eukprot:PDM78503.1 hypothetical protein PRIPAC_31082 [Pristionchus pacificus]
MNASECLLFRELSQNIPYHVLATAKGTLCLAGAFRVSSQWKHYGVRFLVHENTKTLFRFYFALNIIIGALFECTYLFELIRGIGICTVIAAQHVMLVLSFERLYSAIFPAHFEKNSSQLLAISLSLTAIIGTYAYILMVFTNDFELFYESGMELALTTVNIPQNRARYERLMGRVFWFNCLALIILAVDVYMNFFRKRVAISLAVSYQYSENLRILLTLLPIELTQTGVVLFTASALLVYGKLVSNPTPIERQLFLETVTHTTFLPLILSFIIKHSVVKNRNRAPPVEPEVDHFETLRESWIF